MTSSRWFSTHHLAETSTSGLDAEFWCGNQTCDNRTRHKRRHCDPAVAESAFKHKDFSKVTKSSLIVWKMHTNKEKLHTGFTQLFSRNRFDPCTCYFSKITVIKVVIISYKLPKLSRILRLIGLLLQRHKMAAFHTELLPGHSDAQPWASECPDVKNYKWRLNPVWHRMLYSCTHMATLSVKGIVITNVIRGS